jgi:hypothetical protein
MGEWVKGLAFAVVTGTVMAVCAQGNGFIGAIIAVANYVKETGLLA